MKKKIFLLVIVSLVIPNVCALSSDLKAIYAPRETMIGEITGAILAPIQRDQVKVLKDGHLDVGVQYDVGKLGNKHFVWVIAPTNPGEYTLVLEDVVALVQGVPEIVNFNHDFSVEGGMIPFSVSPGFVLATEEFTIVANSYSGQSTIDVSFPEPRQIELYPGTNYIEFSISQVLGIQDIVISIGDYQVPARVVGADYICGDGRIDNIEVCDGVNLGGEDCTTIEEDFVGGELRCASGCLAFDTSGCEEPQEPDEDCGPESLELCFDEMNCTAIGGHWYNETCNEYGQGAECDAEHVGLCSTPGTCLDAGGYWYNQECNKNPEEGCGPEHLELCETPGTCLDAGGYWDGESCGEEEPICGDGIINGGEECDGDNLTNLNCSEIGFDGGELSCNPEESEKECRYNVTDCFVVPAPGPPKFTVDPGYVGETVYVDREILPYKFRIKNEGRENITGLRFEFNPAKFTIRPAYVESVGVNESLEFNVTFKESWLGTPFKGVVVAHAGDVYEYIVLDINFTSNRSQAVRKYGKNSSSVGPSYYCAELSGFSCGSSERCSGDEVETIDVRDCCLGTCVGDEEDSGSSWIGYLIAGIVLLLLIIIYMRYRKAGKKPKGSPLTSKMLETKKNLP